MILKVFSVFDKATNAYLPPFYCRSKGEAIRSFSAAVNDVKHQFNAHKLDYYLLELGDFDDALGLFTCGEPGRVMSGSEVVVE